MFLRSCKVLSILGLFLLVPLVAIAQWPNDPAENLPIADLAGEQVVPHIAATADGGCYVGWYDQASGNYDVALQRLTPHGVEMFPHNGIIVSAHPQNTWVMDWALIVDGNDNAVLAFMDIRDNHWNLQVYKIDTAGNFLWGADGITLTANDMFKGPPDLAEAHDGDIVVVWPEENATGTSIRMQRLAPDGVPRFDAGGIPVAGEPGQDAGLQRVIPADGSNVIVAWLPHYSFMADRQIAAQKFDANGATVWDQTVAVLDTGTIPMGHEFSLQVDGGGGALLAWTVASGLSFNCFAQHLTHDGTELWPHNGQSVSNVSTYSHIYPTLSYDPVSGDSYLFYRAQNSGQTMWGLYGQKLAADGSRLWEATGKEFLPVSTVWISDPRSVLVTDPGAIVMFMDNPSGSYGEERVLGMRVDPNGDFVWTDETVVMASTLSAKQDLEVIMGNDGAAKAVWQDERNDGGDIYGQNLNGDGSLGEPGVPVFLTEFVVQPEAGSITITWSVHAPNSNDMFWLMGRQGDVQWDVAYQGNGSGDYSALDRPFAHAGGTVVVYSLYYRITGSTWQLLSERTVALEIPALALKGASPNPFNPQTVIAFTLDRVRNVRITICDLRGRRLALLSEDTYGVGEHEIVWQGTDGNGRMLSSGTYLIRMEGDDFVRTQKVMLMR
jgi:hypothetical protein